MALLDANRRRQDQQRRQLGVLKKPLAARVLSVRVRLELAREVTAPVLTKIDLQVLVVLKGLDPVDGLDGVGDVDEVDEGTVLFLKIVDLLNVTKLQEVLAQLGGVEEIEVGDVAHVDVARGTVRDCQRESVGQGARVLAPAHLDAAVVDREAVQLAHGEKLRRGDGVYECDEANVALLQKADALEQAATHHVADLLDGQVLMQVAQVNGAVAQVVGAAGLGSNLRRRSRLLHQRQRDVFAVGRGDNVLHAGGQPQILRGVVLLRLGDEGAAVLTVKAFFVQVLVLQRQVGHAPDGAQNGQKVDEGDTLLGDNLDAVNHPVGGQIRPQLRLSDHLARERVVQVAQVDVARGAVALDQLGHHGQDRRILAPSDADVVAVDVELLQDAVRVEQQRRLVVNEGDKRAVLGGQDLHQLEDPRPHVVKELVWLDVAGDVAEVHRARWRRGRGEHLCGVCVVRGGVLARPVLHRLGRALGVLMVLLRVLMLLMLLMLMLLMLLMLLLMMQVVQLQVLRMQMLL